MPSAMPARRLSDATTQLTSASAPNATTIMSKRRERRRQTAGILLDQPIAGKTRDDAPADQRDQQHDHGNADTDADIGGAVEMRFEVKRDVAGQQHHHQRDDVEILPVAARCDLARRCRGNQQQKTRIDQHRGPPADAGGECHREASGDPDGDKRRQRRALQRQASGPVRDRREQEAGDDGRQIAVEHFVHVPVARREGGSEPQLAVKQRQPHEYRQRRLDRAEQEERPKAVGEQRQAPVLAVPGNAAGDGRFGDCRSPAHFAAACCARRSNSVAKTCFALPVCGSALAASRLSGLPTTTRATMPIA